ncbi:MAG: hypothetical protein H0X35_09245 [Pseudonocardiales bacterium]|nr:hypothetical protein [Pseudonocardiales bacterium]
MNWEVHGGPTDNGEFGTFLWVRTDRGLVGGGGHYGPALTSSKVTSLSVHRWSPGASLTDNGIHYIVGRVRADVAAVQLHIVGAQPSTRELSPVGVSNELQLAFVADILPSAADLVRVTALDDQGRSLEDSDWGAHAGMLRGQSPGSG